MMANIYVATLQDDNGSGTQVGTLSWAIAAANYLVRNNFTIPPTGVFSSAQHVITTAQGTFDLINETLDSPNVNIRFDRQDAAYPSGTNPTPPLYITGALPEIRAPFVTIDGTLASGQRAKISGSDLGGLKPGLSVGLRYDGLVDPLKNGASPFKIQNLQIEAFESAPIQIRALGEGDSVVIDNVVSSGNASAELAVPGIEFIDTPSGSGYFDIKNSTIENNSGNGILVNDSSYNPTVAPNRILANTIKNNSFAVTPYVGDPFVNNLYRAQIVAGNIRKIDIQDSTIVGINLAAGVLLDEIIVDVAISGNNITTTSNSSLALGGGNHPDVNKYRIFDNTYTILPNAAATPIIQPIDYLNYASAILFDPNRPLTGGTGAPNPAKILQDQITLQGSSYQIPFQLHTGVAGDYILQVYRLVSNTWTPIDSQLVSAPAGDFFSSFTLGTGQIDLGDKFSVTVRSITPTASNKNETTEFAFPTTTSFYELRNNGPQILNIQFDNTNAAGAPYSMAQRVPLGQQLRPLPIEGTNQIKVHFNDVVKQSSFTTGTATLRGSNGFTFTFTSANRTFDATNKIVTYTLPSAAFPNGLPADKYRLELTDAITDTLGYKLDGEWDTIAAATALATPTWDNFADDQTGRSFLTGNGTAGTTAGGDPSGGVFRFLFSVLPGDANQDGLVTIADGDSNLDNQITIADVGVSDVTGDGLVDASDSQFVASILAAGTVLTLPGRNQMGQYATSGDYDDNEYIDPTVLDVAGMAIYRSKDYDVWRVAFGNTSGTGLRADGNSNGSVDAPDYNVWRDNVGKYTGWFTGTLAPTVPGGIPVSNPVTFGAPPKVTNVTVRGSASLHAPFSFSSVVNGSGAQLQTVPVGGADTIAIKFSEDVNITAGSLRLQGLWSNNRPVLAAFNYDIGNQTATWRFTNWAVGDQYLISLADSVTDIEGNRLDGEWNNPRIRTLASGASVFPSGNGSAGGSFNFVASLLPGDADLNGIVDLTDYNIFVSNYGTAGGSGMLFTQGDFTGDGGVTFSDLGYLASSFGRDLRTLQLLGDLNNDWKIDDTDRDIFFANFMANLSAPTSAQGNFDGDSDIDINDLDILFGRLGMGLSLVG